MCTAQELNSNDDFNDTDAMEYLAYELDPTPKDCRNCGNVWTAEVTCHYCGESLDD